MHMRKAFKVATQTAVVSALLLGGAVAGSDPAGEWAWKYRVLVVFAPDGEDAALLDQREQLTGLDREIAERHMSVIEVVSGEATTLQGAKLDISGSDMVRYVRKQNAQFEVLLLGKDTGIKLRSFVPVTANEIFSLIDTMPMRRQEMRAGRAQES